MKSMGSRAAVIAHITNYPVYPGVSKQHTVQVDRAKAFIVEEVKAMEISAELNEGVSVEACGHAETSGCVKVEIKTFMLAPEPPVANPCPPGA